MGNLFGSKLIVFYHIDTTGKLSRISGSDGVYITDGRWSIETILLKARKIACKKYNKCVAFRIERWFGFKENQESVLSEFIYL